MIQPSFRCVTFSLALATVMSGHLSAQAGQWRSRGPDIVGADLEGVTSTSKGYLAVGAGGTLATSANGRDWFVNHVNSRDWLRGIGYGSGHFVTVGMNSARSNPGRGVIWTSKDGLNWVRAVEDAHGALTRVVYGNDRFVAVGGSGLLTMGGVTATSLDGVGWDVRGLSYPASYVKDVVFTEDRFLYAAYSGVFASNDGINWTNTASTLALPIGLAAQGSTVVGVGRWGAVQRSVDGGRTWENGAHVDGGGFMDVASAQGLFVGVGVQGHIATSVDGLSWVDRDSGTTANLKDAAYGPGGWVVVGSGGAIVTSLDGTRWETVSSPTPSFSDVAFGSNGFVAVGGGAMARSQDGVAWETIQGQSASSITFGNGLYVAVGRDIKVSADGTNWTVSPFQPHLPLSKVAYGAGQFVAVGGVDAMNSLESIACRSADGINWTQVFVNSVGNLDSLAFAGGVFIAHTSVYGQTVAIGNLAPPGLPNYIPAGGLAGGHAGLLAVERSGYVWVGGKRTAQPFPASLNGGAYANGHYFVFGGGVDGRATQPTGLWVSEDGVAWRDLSPPTDRMFRAAAVGHGHVVIVGDYTVIERALDDGLVDSTRLAITRSASSVRLTWLSRQGQYYRLDASTALTAWERVADASGKPLVWAGTGEWLTWETKATTPMVFYRLSIAAQ